MFKITSILFLLFLGNTAQAFCEDPFFNQGDGSNKVIVTEEESMWSNKAHLESQIIVEAGSQWTPGKIVLKYYPEKSNFCLGISDLVIITDHFEAQANSQLNFENRKVWILASSVNISSSAHLNELAGLNIYAQNIIINNDVQKGLTDKKIPHKFQETENWSSTFNLEKSENAERDHTSGLILRKGLSLAQFFFKNQNLNIIDGRFENLEKSYDIVKAVLNSAPQELVEQIKAEIGTPETLVYGTNKLDLTLLIHPEYGPTIYEALWLEQELLSGRDPYGRKSFYLSKAQVQMFEVNDCSSHFAKTHLNDIQTGSDFNFFRKQKIAKIIDECGLLESSDYRLFLTNEYPIKTLHHSKKELELLAEEIEKTVQKFNSFERISDDIERNNNKMEIVNLQSKVKDKITSFQAKQAQTTLERLYHKVADAARSIKYIQDQMDLSKKYNEVMKTMPLQNIPQTGFEKTFEIFSAAVSGTNYGQGTFNSDTNTSKWDFDSGTDYANLAVALVQIFGVIERQNHLEKVENLKKKKKEISDLLLDTQQDKETLKYMTMLNQQLDNLTTLYTEIDRTGILLQNLSRKLSVQENYRAQVSEALSVKTAEISGKDLLGDLLLTQIQYFKERYVDFLSRYEYVFGESYYGQEVEIDQTFEFSLKNSNLKNLKKCFSIFNMLQNRFDFLKQSDNNFVNLSADQNAKKGLMNSCLGVLDSLLAPHTKVKLSSGQDIYLSNDKQLKYYTLEIDLEKEDLFLKNKSGSSALLPFKFGYKDSVSEPDSNNRTFENNLKNIKLVDFTILVDIIDLSSDESCSNSPQIVRDEEFFKLDSEAFETQLTTSGQKVLFDVSKVPAYKSFAVDLNQLEKVIPDLSEDSISSEGILNKIFNTLSKKPLLNLMNRSLINDWKLEVKDFDLFKKCTKKAYLIFKYSSESRSSSND